MKKIIILVLAFSVLLTVFAACSDTADSGGGEVSGNTATTTTTESVSEQQPDSGIEPAEEEEELGMSDEKYIGYNEDDAETFALLDEANNNWLTSFNENAGDVAGLYIEKAVLFDSKNNPIRGNDEISEFYKYKYQEISEITKINIEARFIETASYIYEKGYLITVDDDEMQYVVTWKKQDGSWLRELEALEKKTQEKVDFAEIDKARAEWLRLGNAGSAEALITGMFTENASYYNRGRLLQGHSEITKEYSYVNDSKFDITLETIYIKAVQPDLAYEIGRYTSYAETYKGYYIFIWVKQADGEWKVSLDSNY